MININANINIVRSSGGGTPGEGTLFGDLIKQEGNASSEIKVRITSYPFAMPDWSFSAATNSGQQRAYPSFNPGGSASNNKSPHAYIALEPISSEEPSPPTNPKWEKTCGVSFIQKAPSVLGSNKWFHYAMQRNGDKWIRLGDISFGEVQLKKWQIANVNYQTSVYTTGSSSTNNVVWPTTAPIDISLTMNEESLPLIGSVDMGIMNSELAIPTSHPTMLNVNLPTGLDLSPGETLSIYGDSSNFFVVGVARYNQATGSCYCWSIFHAGSGTFGSWTIRKEMLLYVYPTGFEGSRRAHCVLQSYNEGSKVAVLKVINTVGAAFTPTGWTVTKVMEPRSIPSTQGNTFSSVNVSPRASFCILDFNGTGFNVRHQTDNRGTGWRFIYADGPDIDDPPEDVIVDTYSSSLVSTVTITIANGLTNGNHRWIAVAIESPSGLSANTFAWIKSSSTTSNTLTSAIFRNYEEFVEDYPLAHKAGQSIGEIVYIFAQPGEVTTVATFPFHGATLASNGAKDEQVTILVDGNEVDQLTIDEEINPYLLVYQPCTKVEIVQSGTIFNYHRPEDGDQLVYSSKHSLDKYGWNLEYFTLTTLVAQRISQFYANMFDTFKSWGLDGRITAQGGVWMEYDPVSTAQFPMIEGFKYKEAFIHQSFEAGKTDVVVADLMTNMDVWREGLPSEAIHHIQNNVDDSVKFRIFPMRDAEVSSGFSFTIKNRKYIGYIGNLLL